MKVEHKNEFKAITITLETEEEATIIREICHSVAGDVSTSKAKELTALITKELYYFGVPYEGGFFEGYLNAKK